MAHVICTFLSVVLSAVMSDAAVDIVVTSVGCVPRRMGAGLSSNCSAFFSNDDSSQITALFTPLPPALGRVP